MEQGKCCGVASSRSAIIVLKPGIMLIIYVYQKRKI